MKKLLFIFLIIFSSQSFANVTGKSLYCKYTRHGDNFHIGLHFLNENKIEVFYIKGTKVETKVMSYEEKGLDRIVFGYGHINRKDLTMYFSFYDYHTSSLSYQCALKDKNEKFLTRQNLLDYLYHFIENSGNQL